jgi:general secretion pathway protein E
VAEYLQPNEAIERLIFARADHADIEREAVAAGMIPIFEAGLRLALDGLTTLAELERSIHAEA